MRRTSKPLSVRVLAIRYFFRHRNMGPQVMANRPPPLGCVWAGLGVEALSNEELSPNRAHAQSHGRSFYLSFLSDVLLYYFSAYVS